MLSGNFDSYGYVFGYQILRYQIPTLQVSNIRVRHIRVSLHYLLIGEAC